MSVSSSQHHHRNSTKTAHKPFKPRFASKNALRDRAKGCIDGLENGNRKSRRQHVMSKLDRRNQAKQRRLANQQDHARITSIFAGRDGAARNVAVVPLSPDLDVRNSIRCLNEHLDIASDLGSDGEHVVHVERFKQRICYLPASRDLWSALDVCRAADYVVFVLSAKEPVDDLGQLMLRSIESQGVSNVYSIVEGLDSTDGAKQRKQALDSLKSFISHFFPEQDKLYSLDARQESQNLVRSLCTTTPKGVSWRDCRSWMLVENVTWLDSPDSALVPNQNGAVFTGVVRGKSLKADRLISIGDVGEFQIEKITSAPRPAASKHKSDSMVTEDFQEKDLDVPTADQDGLDELAPLEVAMDESELNMSMISTERKGVLVDNQLPAPGDEDEDNLDSKPPRRLPKGTSNYQAAWYLGDESDSGSDLESVEMNEDIMMTEDLAGPADGTTEDRMMADAATEVETEYPASEGAFADPSIDADAGDLAEFRATRKNEAQEDLRFPDEIELHPNSIARERLAKYRGLKSLRTSPWDIEEDRLYQPEEWSRLLDVSDYRSAKNKVMNDSLVGGVKAGSRVHVHVRGLPASMRRDHDASKPLVLYSLLRHEHKRTSVNFTLTVDSEYPQAIKSKEEIIMQCGPRRFVIQPVFSQGGSPPNDVHKMERFAHPGRTVVASFTAPLTWGAVPAVFFSMHNRQTQDVNAAEGAMVEDSLNPQGPVTLLGTGTALPVSTSRVVVKRIVLTGQAYKIHKKLVTIRYMFFNAEDVAWFKALQLWTNHGRQGTVRESLGTHGYFKAVFDGRIGMQDAIGVSLYKRVWPRPAKRFLPG